MDIDSGAFQAEEATRRSTADSMQSSGGLTRYHSAPSALLASLLDDDLFSQEPSTFSQAQESDFARFFCGELEPVPSLGVAGEMNVAGAPFNVNAAESQQHAGESRMIATGSQYAGVPTKPTSNARGGPLSAISEHGLEDSLDVFNSPQFPAPDSQLLAHSNHRSLSDMKPIVTSGSNLSEAKNNLIRHNSSPADFLSRLVMEECSESTMPQFSRSYTSNLVEAMPERNTGQSNRFSALARPVQAVRSTNSTGINCVGQPNDARGGLLSAISEHGVEDSLDVFSSPQFLAPNSQLLPHSNDQALPDMKPAVTSGSNISEAKTNLIRHNSSPADILSRLVMEECSERPMVQFSGSYTSDVVAMPESKTGQSNCFPERGRPVQTVSGTNNTGISCMGQARDGTGLDPKMRTFGSLNRSGLLRQSSSPAGLLSQLAVDVLLVGNEKTSISSPSGKLTEEGTFDRSTGTPVYANQATSVLDEVGMELAMEDDGAFGQRKRGRGLEIRIPQDMGVTTSPRSTAELNLSQLHHHNHSVGSSSGRLASIDGSFEESVLCKIRAKRGCATHPRSIAERVRRTKISDGMRKLQELVPKLDKQINTADMLDEAVEYVKFLQRQVQELSVNRCNCSGTCHAKETAGPEA